MEDTKEKRKRQSAACDGCRKSKRGCDGQVPCKVCVSRNIACTWALERRRQTRKTIGAPDAVKGGNVGTDASTMALMLDVFFEHWSHIFGCINRASLLEASPPLPVHFLLHSVLSIANRSYGDTATKEHHEREARRLAGLVIDQFTEETAQAYICLSFYYMSENLSLSGHFARMAESVLTEVEANGNSGPGFQKIRGLCRALRVHTDSSALLSSPFKLENFVAMTPEKASCCSIQFSIFAGIADLIRDCADLTAIFYSTNAFADWPEHIGGASPCITPKRARDFVAMCTNIQSLCDTPSFKTLPIAARWGCRIAVCGIMSLGCLLGLLREEAMSHVNSALDMERPSPSVLLAVKPMVVPFLACLALVMERCGHQERLPEVVAILLRLGRVFRSAWLGYNELAPRMPAGATLPGLDGESFKDPNEKWENWPAEGALPKASSSTSKPPTHRTKDATESESSVASTPPDDTTNQPSPASYTSMHTEDEKEHGTVSEKLGESFVVVDGGVPLSPLPFMETAAETNGCQEKELAVALGMRTQASLEAECPSYALKMAESSLNNIARSASQETPQQQQQQAQPSTQSQSVEEVADPWFSGRTRWDMPEEQSDLWSLERALDDVDPVNVATLSGGMGMSAGGAGMGAGGAGGMPGAADQYQLNGGFMQNADGFGQQAFAHQYRN